MLDGHAQVEALFAEAKRLEMPALAITDHGNLFGAFDFYKAGQKAGVKPIIGLEGYYMPVGSRFDKAPFEFDGAGAGNIEDGGGTGVGKLNYTHMTMWAETTEGMHNLFRISSLSWLEGQYGKWPRYDRDLLEKYGKGLIATTGCPSGEVQKWLLADNYDRALAAAADYRDIFGSENFFVELMDHNIDIEKRTRDGLLRIARALDIPMVATNDLHYVRAEDAKAHDALLCIQTGSRLSEVKRFKFDSNEFYVKSAAQMRAIFKDVPEACDNTLLIAERCNVKFTEGQDLLPRFPAPEGMTQDDLLAVDVKAGLEARFADLGKEVPPEYYERMEYELGVVKNMGFPGYFLVVADLVRYAKENGIRVGPGRGSAAGALIAWALGITELDPILHGLLFERFLNPDRISMPDIDMDFDDRRRAEVIKYATEKYGEERVAQIITYSTMKAKAAIKDAARILDFDFKVGDEITKKMPPAVMGKEITLEGVFNPKDKRYKEAQELRNLYEDRADVKQVIDIARGIEGARRQWGVHAAGVILSAEPLLDVIPILRRAADGAIITQFDMGACEKLGLLKMDFLGLRNLTVLNDTLDNIKLNKGIDVVLEKLPLDDANTYELLKRGDTLGVFQLDGGPMRELLKAMVPTSFSDISAVIALYRPGPMGVNAHFDYADRKNGRKEIEPIHPELAEALQPILGETYGVIVYQEQVMAVAQQLAGYTLGQADLLRRAMGKKDRKILDKEFVRFEEGMKQRGFSEAAITQLWQTLEPFADYAFNKSHSAAYGMVSYWTAYLKANYPAEYMAALLTSVKDDRDKLALYLNECRHMGIKVLPPDVNESRAEFASVGNDIRFGLTAIKNVGVNVVDSIIETRESSGKFTSFIDFLQKIELTVLNKRLIESLIKAGAFDSLGQTRRGLINVHVEAVEAISAVKREKEAGNVSLFDSAPVEEAKDELTFGMTLQISTDEWDRDFLLASEREMLGLYVSDHPLAGIEDLLRDAADLSTAEAFDRENNETFTLAGLITGVQRRVAKKNGETWATVTIEDMNGSVTVNFYQKVYALFAPRLIEDTVVSVKVRLQKGEDDARLSALEMNLIDVTRAQKPITISLNTTVMDEATMQKMQNILLAHPGETTVILKVINFSRVTKIQLEDKFRVNSDDGLFSDLKALLGPNCLS